MIIQQLNIAILHAAVCQSNAALKLRLRPAGRQQCVSTVFKPLAMCQGMMLTICDTGCSRFILQVNSQAGQCLLHVPQIRSGYSQGWFKFEELLQWGRQGR